MLNASSSLQINQLHLSTPIQNKNKIYLLKMYREKDFGKLVVSRSINFHFYNSEKKKKHLFEVDIALTVKDFQRDS